MKSSVLHPPNHQLFSDAVIRQVVQRSSPLSRSVDPSRTAAVNSIQAHRAPEVLKTHGRDELNAQAAATNQIEQSANARAPQELNRRRQRNRKHQARYKKKQNDHKAGLEEGNQQLREQIQELRTQQKILLLIAPMSNNIWNVVAEYFRLFRFGVQVPEFARSATDALCPFDPHVQRSFLRSTMTPDVTDGDVFGVEAVMQKWRGISLCTPDLAIKLERLENGPAGSLIATTRQKSTITEDMMRFAFPNLANKADGVLADRLLGHKIVMHGTVNFEWDDDSNRLGSFVFKADMVSPLLSLLGSLEDVARVFDNARISPEFEWLQQV